LTDARDAGCGAVVLASVTPPRRNAIGALRLILASMVIFAHCPELLDGTRAREPITRIFHNGLTFGSLAVDGFFLLSGYLIAGSWMSDPRGYFRKRVLRIYPAFIACSVILAFIVGPLAGGAAPVHPADWLKVAYRIAILHSPVSVGAFSTLHIPALDASMWTIAYEFRCYVLAALLGAVGLFKRPRVVLGIALALLALALVPLPGFETHVEALIGNPAPDARLAGVFLIGTCFKLFKIPLDGRIAGAAFVAALGLLFVRSIAEPAFVLLGGYALFWVALKATWKPLLLLHDGPDASYGLYLWAWPISALLILYQPAISLGALIGETSVLALAAGLLSWFVVEDWTRSLQWPWPAGAAQSAA
jgi:peptidoglycan/LPS O-acetylase OafA/YrhL